MINNSAVTFTELDPWEDNPKSCVSCKWFRSFFEIYDSNDPEEPTDYGWCNKVPDDLNFGCDLVCSEHDPKE